ncbi:hypothetical protein OS965_25085 [Streptomyces sp. H27-G5]|uniref:hypothetical protein n=1 Tax=Streptomyces sp. H27-G5 TaxID=2996698 RepID=UPI00226FB3EE|nr:hypothetical protein [Streptomyces sp. H27-G5]MCY0921425.1 hypothetical protein [Streptomyces sp. H27-G5]
MRRRTRRIRGTRRRRRTRGFRAAAASQSAQWCSPATSTGRTPPGPGAKANTDPAAPNRGHPAAPDPFGVPVRANRAQWSTIRSATARWAGSRAAAVNR